MTKQKKQKLTALPKTRRINLCRQYMNLIQKMPKIMSQKIKKTQCYSLDNIMQQVQVQILNTDEALQEMKRAADQQKQRINVLKSEEELMTAENIEGEQEQKMIQWGFPDDVPSSRLVLPPVIDEIYLMGQKEPYIDFFL